VRGVEAMESSGEWLPGILNELDARGISRQAADSAGWSGGQEGFDQRLELEPSGDGELEVGFSAPQEEMAARGANAYAAAFVEEMRSMGGDRLAGGALGAEASLERSARAPEVPARRPFVLGFAALAPGLAAGAAAALALARRDRNWRDAEFALGAPVLGVIPEREPASHGKESAVDGKL
ncbi:MAG: hypothetical protein L0G70_09050, partial [Rubrobacter sp.]|nr:hypothetical protein [Rubrobacter sp.]